MSYTLHQYPDTHVPAYNDIIYVVSSSNNGQSNYKYIADIIIGSETIRLKCFPHPTYGSGVFNLGRIIETYVNKYGSDIDNYDTTTTGWEINPNFYKKFYVSFGEEYGSSSGIVEHPNITSDRYVYAWNGIVDYLKFQSYSEGNYLASNNKVLNYYNSDLVRKIQMNQMSWIYAIQKNVTDYSSGIITAYNSANAVIRQCSVINPFNNGAVDNDKFIRFGCGTSNLNYISSGVVDYVGSGNIIPTNTSYYEVFLGGNSVSKTFRFNIEDSDCKYTTYRLHWLNKLGAYESFNFNKKNYIDTDINKSNYKRITGGLTSASAFGYNISDRGTRTFNNELKDTLHLKSDWLSDQEYILLQSLIESPEIYIETLVYNGDTYTLVPVTCTDKKFKQKTILNDKVYNLDITLEYCFIRNSQRQ